MTILYKLNSDNTMQYWECEVGISGENHTVIISWGTMPRAKTLNVQTLVFPRHIEAQNEADSRTQHMLDRKGYSFDIPKTQPDLPMLAQEYNSRVKLNKFALQPKLDGVRCIATPTDMISRRNLSFSSCPHIELYLPYIPEGVKLDGELIIPNVPQSTIESYCMRHTPDLKVSKIIEYHIFDIVDTELDYTQRHKKLKEVIAIMEKKYFEFHHPTKIHPYSKHPWLSPICPFKLVPTTFYDMELLSSPEIGMDFDDIIKKSLVSYKSQGHEGVIIRDISMPYEINKRSSGLFKLKQFIDHEFEIVDVEERANQTGVFICKTLSGMTFACSLRCTTSRKKQLLLYKEQFIGKWLKVEYEGLTVNNLPRCPVGIDIFEARTKPIPTAEPIITPATLPDFNPTTESIRVHESFNVRLEPTISNTEK